MINTIINRKKCIVTFAGLLAIFLLFAVESTAFAAHEPPFWGADFTSPLTANPDVTTFTAFSFVADLLVDENDLADTLKSLGGTNENGNAKFTPAIGGQLAIFAASNRQYADMLPGDTDPTYSSNSDVGLFTVAFNNELGTVEVVWLAYYVSDPTAGNTRYGATNAFVQADINISVQLSGQSLIQEVSVAGSDGFNLKMKVTGDLSDMQESIVDPYGPLWRLISDGPNGPASQKPYKLSYRVFRAIYGADAVQIPLQNMSLPTLVNNKLKIKIIGVNYVLVDQDKVTANKFAE